MKIEVYSIQKDNEYEEIIEEYLKKISTFCNIKDNKIFNKTILKAQKINEIKAKESYTKTFEKYLKNGYNIALDVNAKEIDSFTFAKMLQNKSKINFFIAGAYGWESSFLEKCDTIISLSKLTMSHKIAKIVLYEQIFRGFSINNNHPYHK